MTLKKHCRFAQIFGMMVFLIFLLDLYPQTRSRMTVVLENERRMASVSSIRKDGVLYASLTELADLLNVKHYFNPQNQKLVIRVGSHAVIVTALNPFIMVDETVFQMALPPLDPDRSIYVPVGLFFETVGKLFASEFSFENNAETLRIRNFTHNITAVEIEEKLNGSLIRFVTTKNFNKSDVVASINRGWLNVTLYRGSLDSVRIASNRQIGIVKQIKSFQFEESAQVSFLLDREVEKPSVYVNEGEVQIALRTTKPIDPAILNNPSDSRNRWLIDRIILDPGHGGKDPGAIGRSGTMEKEINLNIAQRLKKLLTEQLNVEVLLTREDDKYVSIYDRTKFANAKDGKLFISIHCNANNNRNVSGFSTYLLGPAKNEQALRVAERENSVIAMEENTDIYDEYDNTFHILNANAQNMYLRESEDLARMVAESFKKRTRLSPLGDGVDQHMAYVLVGAAMPRILIEIAFISNAGDERYLRTNANRQKIAEALFESIKKFKEKYERGIGK